MSDAKGPVSSKVPGLSGRIKSRGKRHILASTFPEVPLFPKQEGSRTTKKKEFKAADTGVGQDRGDPGRGPHSGIPVWGHPCEGTGCPEDWEGSGTGDEGSSHQIPAGALSTALL